MAVTSSDKPTEATFRMYEKDPVGPSESELTLIKV